MLTGGKADFTLIVKFNFQFVFNQRRFWEFNLKPREHENDNCMYGTPVF